MVGIRPVGRIIPIYRSVREIPGIVEMYEVTGEHDLIMKVVARDMKDLRTMVNEIRSRKGVHSLEASVCYNKVA
jgi:Lrp/AsnC family transcriptional regulator for asnA, asnC and gidA